MYTTQFPSSSSQNGTSSSLFDQSNTQFQALSRQNRGYSFTLSPQGFAISKSLFPELLNKRLNDELPNMLAAKKKMLQEPDITNRQRNEQKILEEGIEIEIAIRNNQELINKLTEEISSIKPDSGLGLDEYLGRLKMTIESTERARQERDKLLKDQKTLHVSIRALNLISTSTEINVITLNAALDTLKSNLLQNVQREKQFQERLEVFERIKSDLHTWS